VTHATCRLTAKNRDQLRNPTLGNRVWATFLPTALYRCPGGLYRCVSGWSLFTYLLNENLSYIVYAFQRAVLGSGALCPPLHRVRSLSLCKCFSFVLVLVYSSTFVLFYSPASLCMAQYAAYCYRCIAWSVCLSVCLSVTSVSCAKTHVPISAYSRRLCGDSPPQKTYNPPQRLPNCVL